MWFEELKRDHAGVVAGVCSFLGRDDIAADPAAVERIRERTALSSTRARYDGREWGYPI